MRKNSQYIKALLKPFQVSAWSVINQNQFRMVDLEWSLKWFKPLGIVKATSVSKALSVWHWSYSATAKTEPKWHCSTAWVMPDLSFISDLCETLCDTCQKGCAMKNKSGSEDGLTHSSMVHVEVHTAFFSHSAIHGSSHKQVREPVWIQVNCTDSRTKIGAKLQTGKEVTSHLCIWSSAQIKFWLLMPLTFLPAAWKMILSFSDSILSMHT